MQQEIADLRITIKVKHMYAVLFTVVGITATAVYGWLDLKAEAKSANTNVFSLEKRVSRIECLIEQGNNYQIYKIKPVKGCD